MRVSGSPEPHAGGTPSPSPEPGWVRRRRLAAVFGDVLPDETSDDRAPASDPAGKGDDWYRDQVPPHHG